MGNVQGRAGAGLESRVKAGLEPRQPLVGRCERVWEGFWEVHGKDGVVCPAI